jgi:hypothetical protein
MIECRLLHPNCGPCRFVVKRDAQLVYANPQWFVSIDADIARVFEKLRKQEAEEECAPTQRNQRSANA